MAYKHCLFEAGALGTAFVDDAPLELTLLASGVLSIVTDAGLALSSIVIVTC